MSKGYNGKFTARAKTQADAITKKKKPKRRTWQWILLSVLLVLLALIVATVIFVVSTLNKINRTDPNETRISPEQWAQMENTATEEAPDGANYPTVNEADISLPTHEGQGIGAEESIVNILLIGQDRREGEARSRSDSMILVSFNKETGNITLASFLRDLYVTIPGGYQDNRLNTAYAIGGMELLDETLEVNFGVKIDCNVEVDFSRFSEIIDILGGVDIELTGAEAHVVNQSTGSGLSAGMNHLDGQEALAYTRIRSLDSDFGRTSRQRNVINALIQQFKNIGLTDALDLMDQVLPMLTTDLSNMDIIGYVTDLLPMLTSAEVATLHIPGDEDYYNASIRGMDVLVPDLPACREMLAEALQ